MKHSRKRILTTHTGSLPRPPELVADRIPNHANIVGGENVIAGVDCGGAGERTYRKGDSLIEAFETPLQGRNGGKGVVKILVVYAGAVGVPNTVLEGS